MAKIEIEPTARADLHKLKGKAKRLPHDHKGSGDCARPANLVGLRRIAHRRCYETILCDQGRANRTVEIVMRISRGG